MVLIRNILKIFFIRCIIVGIFLFNYSNLYSQEKINPRNKNYITGQKKYSISTDSLVGLKLKHWQSVKFGLMLHFGIYTVREVDASWTICNEDYEWNKRTGKYSEDYDLYKKWYDSSQYIFYPYKFNPEKWVSAAKYAGMKYLVFTTKHHDGFCMFKTTTTDFCITDSKTPYSQNPRANITKEVFNAFRKNDFLIGAYFSKPDWHNNDYWWKYFATPDRNVNYSIQNYPEKWNRFKDFTFAQVLELSKNFGSLDILWLDGNWVYHGNLNQDIGVHKIASIARGNHPGLLMVNRDCGEYEDYLTPEQEVPLIPPDYPWESCIPMSNAWAIIPGDIYKPTTALIHYMIEIVAKGGNYLLNIGVNSAGDLDTAAYRRLSEIGDWMQINSTSIYNTDKIAPFKDSNICYTKKGDTVYVFYMIPENQNTMPAIIKWKNLIPVNGSDIFLLGYENTLSYSIDNMGFVNVHIPSHLQNNPLCRHAFVFKFSRTISIGEIKENTNTIPTEFKLYNNFPNPFNSETEIAFDVTNKEKISLIIYDISGREVLRLLNNEVKNPGKYVVSFKGISFSSGTYFCKMETSSFKSTIRMVLLK